jgi:hypothetical protein
MKQTDHQPDIGQNLRLPMRRFPRGLNLSREDLALIGWLYQYEQGAGIQGISDAQLKWIIAEGAMQLGLDPQSLQPAQVVQRLMRLNILRVALADRAGRGYRLTRLGRMLARYSMEDVDYGAEQLNVLLDSALGQIRSSIDDNGAALLKYLKHVFLGTIREKIEYKILAIEDDLEIRKKEVKQTYSGKNDAAFEQALKDVEYCRIALTELVDAVQESSACVRLEELLHERMGWDVEPNLYEALEQSLDFVYLLRGRVDAMLKDVVQFIHDCIAYRSLAFTVDSRDRLCRIQERILTYALENDAQMPILASPRTSRMDLNWSRQEREAPVALDLDRLKKIEDFRPPDLPSIEPDWKAPLLRMARAEWAGMVESGKGVDLCLWLESLAEKIPEVGESPSFAIWFLTQDWPQWRPAVSVQHKRGQWTPLGKEWMMEAVEIMPVAPAVDRSMTAHSIGNESVEKEESENSGT